MQVVLNVPTYDSLEGIRLVWDDEFEIKISIENNTVLLKSNKAGLTSLANHLLNLAQEKVPSGYHIHLDEYNSLEEGSTEFIIEKY